MSKRKKRERARAGLLFRDGKLIPAGLVKKVEKVMDNKSGVIDKLVATWKKDMRKEIKNQGVSYLSEFDLEAQLGENMEEIEKNFTLRTLAKSIKLTEDDVKQAMEKCLQEMKEEYNIALG